MNTKLIKIIGIASTAIGMCATIVTDWANDKKMDEKIEKKIIEVITKNK